MQSKHRKRPGTRRVVLAAIAVLNCLIGAALYATSLALAAGEPAEVTMDNFIFTPGELKVRRGTTVKFVNHDDIPHNVVDAALKLFRSPIMDTDESFSFTFSEAGTFDYFCALHPQMKARIIVTE